MTDWYALNPEHNREARFQAALDELCAEREAELFSEVGVTGFTPPRPQGLGWFIPRFRSAVPGVEGQA